MGTANGGAVGIVAERGCFENNRGERNEGWSGDGGDEFERDWALLGRRPRGEGGEIIVWEGCGGTSLVIVWDKLGTRRWWCGGCSNEGGCKAALHAGEKGRDERIRGLVILVLLRERIERRQAGNVVAHSGAAP